MPINLNNVVDLVRNNRHFIRLYRGLTIIWEASVKYIRSCFGKGYWRNEKPWINNESWRNN